MRQRIAVAITLGVALLALAGGAMAQQAYTSTSAPPLIVTLDVVSASGVPATISVRNGQMARWKRIDDTTAYALSPVVTDGVARLLVGRITAGETPGTERFQALATLELTQDKATPIPAENPLFTVMLRGTFPLSSQAGPPTPSPAGPCVTCCVTCGDTTVCACAVQMDCGSCCCKTHCPTCLPEGEVASGCALASRDPARATPASQAAKR